MFLMDDVLLNVVVVLDELIRMDLPIVLCVVVVVPVLVFSFDVTIICGSNNFVVGNFGMDSSDEGNVVRGILNQGCCRHSFTVRRFLRTDNSHLLADRATLNTRALVHTFPRAFPLFRAGASSRSRLRPAISVWRSRIDVP